VDQQCLHRFQQRRQDCLRASRRVPFDFAPGRRRRSGILSYGKGSLDVRDYLFRRVMNVYRHRALGLFQVRQLTGENRFAREVTTAGAQAIGN